MTRTRTVYMGAVAAATSLFMAGASACAASDAGITAATPATARPSSEAEYLPKPQPDRSRTSRTGQPAHTKAQPVAPAPPMLVQYQLPPGVVQNSSDDAGLGPSQAHGVLGIPQGKGARPVVVVMHGSHPTCVEPGAEDNGVAARPVKTTWPLVCADAKKPVQGVGPDYLRHDAGLSHLVQALARKGFVAVSIDVTGAEAWWGGEATDPARAYTQLVDAHLKLLADLGRGNNRGLAIDGAKGRIDTSRVGLVGHSRGGGYVLEHSARRPGLFAAVSIQPGSDTAARHTVPVLNIRGACDEDTGPEAGLAGVKALAKSRSTMVAADVLLAGTGHAMLNTNLDPAKDNGGCSASKVTEPATARDQVAQLTADFMDQALRKTTAYRLPALKGPTPTGGNLRTSGPRLTFSPAARHTYTDPLTIREVTTRQRLLPPIPANLTVRKGEEY
ncbi:dienelactone hydrolase family protein [Streptomyces sp. SP18CS02]|uniref:dienelactone hydrolase family protein n=1 Tax=Streptomyces sp. SP18CS02 TaxID=3002531 RepID=UPI002E76D2BC|nr:dienelactone hydrolase family protein [Streptomyces sp. SP18CS02]MEE1754483.1 dienelactone hydrolase family protein [Streptomyces sp. SP18CS02]